MVTKRAPADAPRASEFSRRFRLARNRAGLTQRALATLAKCSESTISEIEAGIHGGGRMPQIDTVEVFARVLNVSPGWLAFGDGPAPEWLADSDRPQAG
jgi:transcriptional regulator with XRE-family HTH domain